MQTKKKQSKIINQQSVRDELKNTIKKASKQNK
jgi:hypothetical protein